MGAGMFLFTCVSALAAPLDPGDFTVLAATLDPTGKVTINGTSMSGGGTSYTGVVQNGVVVFTFGTVVIDQDMDITGSQPVAILSQGTMTVSKHVKANAAGTTPGPGGGTGGDQEGES